MLIRESTLLNALSIGLLLSGAIALAQAPGPQLIVSYPAKYAISPPQSQSPQASPVSGTNIIPVLPIPHAETADAEDGALQTTYGPLVSATPGIQFDGVGANGSAPSDANLAVGPHHIVQMVNVQYAVYDKSGNIFAGYPKTLGSIFNALGAPCNGTGGDPVALYDKAADRWFLSQLGTGSSFLECIAVSTTNDPTGAYSLYSYSFGTTLNDYPKFSSWPGGSNPAYLGTYNLFANGQTFVGADLCAYDRTAMLNSNASATQICFTISNDGGYLPSDLDGSALPPAGSPGYFLNFFDTSNLHLFKLAPNFSNPASSTLTGPINLPVTTFAEACNGGTCIPQEGTRQKLDSLGDRLMYRLAYRNFGDHESLVVNHSVTTGSGRRANSVGVRWYELRAPGGAVNVFQQGTFAPDSTSRWMGSVAMDRAGNIAIGYSISSTAIHPGIAYTGRTPSDPAGTMESEAIMLSGTGSQTTRLSRWGDYSALQIDPSNDCTFWYTNQYLKTDGTFNWSTRIGSFAMNNCVPPPPTLSVVSTVPASGSGSSQTFAVTVSDTAGASAINLVYLLVDSSLNTANACYVEFNRSANTFRLANDAGTGFLGPITLGTATSLANSQCTVNAATGSASTSGNNLKVNIPLDFAFSFSGTKSTFVYASDNSSNSGWVTTGTWTVPNSGPPPVLSLVQAGYAGDASACNQSLTCTISTTVGVVTLSQAFGSNHIITLFVDGEGTVNFPVPGTPSCSSGCGTWTHISGGNVVSASGTSTTSGNYCAVQDLNSTGHHFFSDCWVVLVSASGATGITVTFTDPAGASDITNMDLFVAEYACSPSCSPSVDTQAAFVYPGNGVLAGCASCVGPSMTLTGSNDLVVQTAVFEENCNTGCAVTNYTLQSFDPIVQNATAYGLDLSSAPQAIWPQTPQGGGIFAAFAINLNGPAGVHSAGVANAAAASSTALHDR